MKPRIHRRAVCSSKNYKTSRTVHVQYIQEEHEKNKKLIAEITETSITKKYVMCFGKAIEVTVEEAKELKTIKIYNI